jgi:hypothetical protein
MAISGIQVINIGEPNESVGSDSLYTAFNKSKDNFTQLFACASPYNTFTGNGVTITSNSTAGTINIDNSGVLDIQAGTGVSISSANGVYTISSNGSGNGGGGTVTSIGVLSNTLSIVDSPVVSSGNISVDLPVISPTLAGTYTYPTVTTDNYGRITGIANAVSVGTVTSVGVTPGTGIQVTSSPITTSGNITITNTGVTRLSAGTGISVSSSNGNVTISTTTTGGTVTAVAVSSTSLTVTGSPITTSGTITVNLPANITATGSATLGTFLKLTPGTAPASPTEGMVYYDSTAHKLKVYTGSAWETITSA